MPDRIFTTQEQQDGLGPTQIINTVDYNKVAEMLQEFHGETVPAASEPMTGFAALVTSTKQDVESAETRPGCEPAKSDCPPKIKARKVPKDGMCNSCNKLHPCACDMSKAAMAGDDVAIGIMSELRNQRRYAMLGQYEQELTVVTAQQQQEQQRFAERQAIAEGIAALEDAVAMLTETETPSTSSDPNFQSVDELTASQKERFSKWAEKQGWPPEYVQAFVTPRTAEEDVPEHIMVVASQKELAPEVRQGLIEAMCKEAKLKPEQASRLQKYWSSEVGLPSDWVSKLVKEPEIK